jgi:hypothetical protein
MTTSRFSPDAREHVKFIEKRIVIIDRARLTNLMIDHGVGVANVAIYAVKRVPTGENTTPSSKPATRPAVWRIRGLRDPIITAP